MDNNGPQENQYKGEVQVINIYVPNHYKDKEQCWASLKESLQENQAGKVILGGDLNLVRSIEKQFGGNYQTDPSRNSLKEIMEQHNLLDIPPNNGKYTWSNKIVGKSNIKEMLDRILIQESIVAEYSSIKSKIIHISASDHKPVLIARGKLENQGPLPFRYNSTWDNNIEIKKLVKTVWEPGVEGSPHYIWETKIKNLRAKLKEWARTEEQKKEKEKRAPTKNGQHANGERGQQEKQAGLFKRERNILGNL